MYSDALSLHHHHYAIHECFLLSHLPMSRLIFSVFLQIMCKGNIAHSGKHTQHHLQTTAPTTLKLTRPAVVEFEIKFPVTIKMVPKCRILVYYVRGDKETVADSMEYDVEDVLENQVRGSLFGHAVMIYMGILYKQLTIYVKQLLYNYTITIIK